MHSYTLAHLRDDILLRSLTALVAQDRLTTANLLAYIAEFDFRRLYVPAGHTSMHAFCVEELRLSEDAASKRIQAARSPAVPRPLPCAGRRSPPSHRLVSPCAPPYAGK